MVPEHHIRGGRDKNGNNKYYKSIPQNSYNPGDSGRDDVGGRPGTSGKTAPWRSIHEIIEQDKQTE